MDPNQAKNILQLYYSGDPQYKLSSAQVDALNAAAYPTAQASIPPPSEPNQSQVPTPFISTVSPTPTSPPVSTRISGGGHAYPKDRAELNKAYNAADEVLKKQKESEDLGSVGRFIKNNIGPHPITPDNIPDDANVDPMTGANNGNSPVIGTVTEPPIVKNPTANPPSTSIPDVKSPGKVNAQGQPVNDKGEPIDLDSGLPLLDSTPKQIKSGTYTPISNPLIDAEKKSYAENYGTPEVKPIFSKAQTAQINLLSKNIKGYDETLEKIDKDPNINEDTKNVLRAEINTRRKKSQDYLDSINANPETPGKPETKGIVGDLEQGIKDETALNVKEADDSSKIISEKNEKLDNNDKETEAARKIRMEKAAQLTADLNKRAEHLANYKEDPNRYWNSKSGFDQVVLSMALALGSTQRNNPAKTLIDDQINRDIAAQRQSYEAEKNSFEAKRSIYGLNMERLNDPEAALAASKVMMSEQAIRKLEELKAKNNSPRAQMAGDRALLELKKNRSDADKAFTYRIYQLQHPGTGAGGAINTSVVNDVAEGLGAADSYNNAAKDVLKLSSGGDVNLNPSGLRTGWSGVINLLGGNQAAMEARYGKDGAKIIQRVQQVVTENPVPDEHSDKDRDAAINVILGDGVAEHISQRLAARAQASTTKTQRKVQALPTKQQETLSNRIAPPTAAPLTIQPRQK